MRTGMGRGRHGPGLLRTAGRPPEPSGSPAPASGSGGEGRWLPRHQPWNAASGKGTDPDDGPPATGAADRGSDDT